MPAIGLPSAWQQRECTIQGIARRRIEVLVKARCGRSAICRRPHAPRRP
jgi:hypothetical protein